LNTFNLSPEKATTRFIADAGAAAAEFGYKLQRLAPNYGLSTPAATIIEVDRLANDLLGKLRKIACGSDDGPALMSNYLHDNEPTKAAMASMQPASQSGSLPQTSDDLTQQAMAKMRA
jgi:hypothetical protein